MKAFKINIFLVLLSVSFANNIYSQIVVEPKVNVALASVGIVNPAVEFSVASNVSVQMEFFGAYAKKSFLGMSTPFLATVGMTEGRYYFKDNISGFYTGLVAGTGNWKMNRSFITISNSNRDNYDYGYSVLLGLSLGYKFLINERWGIDLNLGGGWAHSNHEGYNGHGIQQYRLNGSDEWLPFKGGVYVSYRLK